jgi:hypothetical protein
MIETRGVGDKNYYFFHLLELSFNPKTRRANKLELFYSLSQCMVMRREKLRRNKRSISFFSEND